MTNAQACKDLSFSVIQSAFKDLIKDGEIEDIKNLLVIMGEIENKTRKQQSKINRLNAYLKLDHDARYFFEKRKFYPWVEFMDYDADFIVDRYLEFVGG